MLFRFFNRMNQGNLPTTFAGKVGVRMGMRNVKPQSSLAPLAHAETDLMQTLSYFSLDKRTALITGGGTGLGLGMAHAMVGAGARVVITGRREAELAAAVAELGNKATYHVHDVTDLAAAPELVSRIERELGPINILVNNAGINAKRPIGEMSDADAQAIFQTNVMGVYALTRAVSKEMVARKQGSIIMISSMAALYGLSFVSAYGASKAAVAGLTRVLASELSPHNVRVNAIAPGFIESPMLFFKALDADPARKEKVLGRTPMGRFGTSDDIGLAAVWLASDASKFVTGIVLPIDGGNSIGF
jgi:NAD(P)-dependent dehydrogenase (short-subunit alcohol dehydrogenase family)